MTKKMLPQIEKEQEKLHISKKNCRHSKNEKEEKNCFKKRKKEIFFA